MHIGGDARSIFTGGGGDRTYFRNLISTMARVFPEHRWTLYADNDDPDRDSLVAPNISVAPALPAPIPALWNVTTLLPRLRKDQVDILHGQYMLPPFGRPPCAMVVSIHDITFRLFPQWFPRRANKVQNLFIPRSAQRAQYVLTGSQCAADDMVRAFHLPSEKIRVTPYGIGNSFGVPTALEMQRVRTAYGLPEQYLLGVGLLRTRKNAAVVLQAVSEMIGRGQWPNDLQLALTGSWASAPDAEAAYTSSSNLHGTVNVLGYIPDQDLPGLYGAALASVYPSLYEGFGLPPLEAMACGCPTITSQNSSLAEVVGEAGLLVRDYEDPAAWRDALARLLSDKALREQLTARGLARANEFQWERTARETLQVYEEAIDKFKRTK